MSAGVTHLIKPDFLPAADHAAMLEYALSHEDQCLPSATGQGQGSPHRQSLEFKDMGPCRAILRDALIAVLPDTARAIGVTLGPKLRYDGSMNAHTDGAYYRPHVDIGGAVARRSRVLSAVYYFHRTPRGFTGGDLRLFRLDQTGAFVDIPPTDNQLVVFPSMIPHEVRPVSVPSGDFADARFAVNLWVHNMPDKPASAPEN
ncbi:MAG: 2OG-Fe(II) oxygenase [Pseudomonadota bacterium]